MEKGLREEKRGEDMVREKRPITKYDLRLEKSKRHIEAQERRGDAKYQRRPRVIRGRE